MDTVSFTEPIRRQKEGTAMNTNQIRNEKFYAVTILPPEFLNTPASIRYSHACCMALIILLPVLLNPKARAVTE
ncbi:hypothetical protein PAECIP111894_04860 [Paenibacillus pseudetheri]|uniref:Uncharacterized protein n=2 Tax=Paenibacillus pseudetheri TaxID=2897682 RepID=A0ABN8FSX1_9BACL|nr:hypothetical protein PAECIP111894_04860 [Paenibacillus pseudetheri]